MPEQGSPSAASTVATDHTSMLYWWPLVKDLAVPMPETIIVPSSQEALYGLLDGKDLPAETWASLRAAAGKLGYPVFMRTDHSSAKHDYLETCYVRDPLALEMHVWRLIEANVMADFMGLPCEALVVRQFLSLAATFTAFNGLPIAPERRYFVRDGQVACWHSYWPAEAIADGYHRQPLPRTWQAILRQANGSTPGEIALLTGYAATLGAVLPGFWSVDFAMTAGGNWRFIDAAEGARSWHPADCPKVVR